MQSLRLFDCLTFKQLSALTNLHPNPHAIFESTRSGFFSNFGSMSSLMKLNSSLFFQLKMCILSTEEAHKVQLFKLSTVQVKFY